jgi:hypothetical protein
MVPGSEMFTLLPPLSEGVLLSNSVEETEFFGDEVFEDELSETLHFSAYLMLKVNSMIRGTLNG